jgi:hypothetical protein
MITGKTSPATDVIVADPVADRVPFITANEKVYDPPTNPKTRAVAAEGSSMALEQDGEHVQE